MTDLRSVPPRTAMPGGQFRRALTVQGKVIGALLMRELHTRFGRDNIGYLWMFGEPMLLAMAVGAIHSHYHGVYAPGMTPVALGILGYTMFIMFRGMVSRGEGTLESNMQLLYHRTVTVFDMMLSRAILECVATTVTMLILMGFCMATGYADGPVRPLDLLFGILLMAWWSWAISMIVCATTYENPIVARFVHPTVYIALPLSSAFWAVNTLPTSVQKILVWLPMVSIFEQLRYGWFQVASADFLNTGYVVGFNMLMTYIGLVLLRVVRRKVHLQ